MFANAMLKINLLYLKKKKKRKSLEKMLTKLYISYEG